MDIGSLIAAALLSLGLIGTDAVLNAGNVVFRVEVTKKLAERGYTPSMVDALLDSDLKEIVEFKSIVHQTRIRSADQQSIVGSIAGALNLKDVTSAFQSEFGLDSIRLTGSLMDGETGEFRFIIGGESLHTGKFTIDATSGPKETLPEFLAGVAIAIATRLEPYAVAVEKFNTLQLKNKFVEDDTDHTDFQSFVAQQLNMSVASINNEDNRAVLYNLLGMSSLLYHEQECSKQQFERAAQADPELGVPLLNLAVLALTERRFDDAIHLAGMAENAPDLQRVAFLVANTRVVVGLALWGKNDLAGAAEQFHIATVTYPGSMWAYYYWSALETSLDNKDSAAVLLARAEYNLQIFESYPEVALMYVKLDPTADFGFTRVDILRARHLSDLAPLKQDVPAAEAAEKPHGCAM
jgi:tetratricopeptide (TPR) repeat protein